MFQITIKDGLGKTVANFNAERYLALGQASEQFTKSMSKSDFVEQLGLVEFAKQQILLEMAQAAKPEKEVKE